MRHASSVLKISFVRWLIFSLTISVGSDILNFYLITPYFTGEPVPSLKWFIVVEIVGFFLGLIVLLFARVRKK